MRRKLLYTRVLMLALTMIMILGGMHGAAAESAAPAKAKWTVLIYLCGSTLESQAENGSFDLNELSALAPSDEVNLVFETGGTTLWHNDYISADCLTRFRMNGGLQDKQELPVANMGDPYTLGDFLRWGVQTYPAERTMAILWDHGGMIYGAEKDDLYNSLLTVPEIAQGLAQAGIRFDALGFDACLMASCEVASAMAPYARYMIASEEIETARGWNLSVMAQTLLSNPDADAVEVGKAVCDGYLSAQEKWGESEISTMALIDLDQMDGVVKALDNLGKALSSTLTDPVTFRVLSMEMSSSKRYAYDFCHDLADMASRLTKLDSSVTQPIKTAVSKAVVYKANGGDFGYSHGMTVFFSLNASAKLLTIYEAVCPAPDYLAFLDAIHYGWRANTSLYETTARVPDPVLSDYEISFELLPADGINPLHLTGGINAVTSITYNLYRLDVKENRTYLAGSIPNISVGEDNTFTPNFDGQIVTLDGLPIYLSLIDEQPEYTLYESPVLIDGQALALRIAWYPPEKTNAEQPEETTWTGALDRLSDGTFKILGLWDGMGHSGTNLPGRNTIMPRQKTKMTFLEYEIGDQGATLPRPIGTITYDPDKTAISMKTISNGTYSLVYVIENALGKQYQSDPITISVKGGKMTKIP